MGVVNARIGNGLKISEVLATQYFVENGINKN